MSESKSFFGDYNEMAHIWARIQAFDQIFKPLNCSNLQLVLSKGLTLSAALVFVTEGLFIYIYFLMIHIAIPCEDAYSFVIHPCRE